MEKKWLTISEKGIIMEEGNGRSKGIVFLNQIVYIRPNGNIFMEDVTEDEAAAIKGFLDDYRRRQTQ